MYFEIGYEVRKTNAKAACWTIVTPITVEDAVKEIKKLLHKTDWNLITIRRVEN